MNVFAVLFCGFVTAVVTGAFLMTVNVFLEDHSWDYAGLGGTGGAKSRRFERRCRRMYVKGRVMRLEPERAFDDTEYKFIADAKVNKRGRLELKVADCDCNGDIVPDGGYCIVYASDMLKAGWEVIGKR